MNFKAETHHFISAILLKDRALIFFSAAMIFYALWGSPTPNNPDWVEVTIGLLLVAAVGFHAITQNFFVLPHVSQEPWRIAAQSFFLIGLFVPLVMAVMKGGDMFIIVRDVIAFIFLCLPLFLYDFLKHHQARQRVFLGLCVVIGLLFSIRVLVPHFLLFRNTTELLYLANSPLVLMTALLLGGSAMYLIYKKFTFKSVIMASVLGVLCTLPIMAMFVDLQRASFAALILSGLSLSVIGIIKAPLRLIVPFIIICAFSFIFYDYGANLIADVGAKTSQVGLNMRLQELNAVWQQALSQPIYIFIGQGWGATFASPAVGNLNVSYTHSLLSYMFLKTGLLGLFLCLVYLYFIFEKLFRLYSIDGVKGNALIWPFMIPIFLYASHKSFDYGVLLTLILSCSMVYRGQKQT